MRLAESKARDLFNARFLKGEYLLNSEDKELLNKCVEEFKHDVNKHLFWSDDVPPKFQCLTNEEMRLYFEQEVYKPLIEEVLSIYDQEYTFETFKVFSDIQMLRLYYGKDCSFENVAKFLIEHGFNME